MAVDGRRILSRQPCLASVLRRTTGTKLIPSIISATLIVLLSSRAAVSAASRPITVWLIPAEEGEVRATPMASEISREMKDFNDQLARGRVRVLNTQPPLDTQLIVWNEAFAVPNWAWIKNQTET